MCEPDGSSRRISSIQRLDAPAWLLGGMSLSSRVWKDPHVSTRHDASATNQNQELQLSERVFDAGDYAKARFT